MKLRIPASLIMCLLAIYACNETKQQEKQEKATSEVLQAPYATVFYDSLQVAMDAYYDLTDGLSKSNLTYTDKWAGVLKQHIDSLPLHSLQMDSTRLEQVKINTGSISAELAGLQGETTLEAKRVSFQMLSDMMYDLVGSTGLKGKTIYRQYCPMAFNDRGAFWLSKSTQLQNPYFGNEMLGCVEVTDSLRY